MSVGRRYSGTPRRSIPPATGIVHQVNLEYLARVVFDAEKNGERVAYPDTVVGTDSHTTMINGIGVVGWGVGGIEAEAGMLGQPVYFLTPDVVGVISAARSQGALTLAIGGVGGSWLIPALTAGKVNLKAYLGYFGLIVLLLGIMLLRETTKAGMVHQSHSVCWVIPKSLRFSSR